MNRNIIPQTNLPNNLQLPNHNVATTINGVKLYTINTGENPVVRLSIVFRCGSRYQKHPFTSSATLNMLSEGTKKLTSAQISETLDFYGIFYDTSIDRDFSIITVNCLEKFLPQTIDLLKQLILNPTFPPHELETYKTKRKEQLRIEREKPAYLARELFSIALFGEKHPYGIISQAADYDTLTVEHIKEYFDQYFTADNCFAVASGLLSDETLSQIESLLTQLPSGIVEPHTVEPLQTSAGEHLEREDALQTSIRIGKPLFTKGHPDYNGMQVVSMVLGGYFGSRLVQNLREERGYTYGIYSAMVSMEHAGYFAIATDVTAEYTDDAIGQIFFEIERMQRELVSDEELMVVKNMIVGEMMRIIDGPFGVSDVVIDNIQSGMDAAYLDEFLQQVRSITAEQIRDLACKYLSADSFTTVTVGSRSSNQI